MGEQKNLKWCKKSAVLSFLLCFALVFQLFPVETYAKSDNTDISAKSDEPDMVEEIEEDTGTDEPKTSETSDKSKDISPLVAYTQSGTCGPNLTWDLKDNILVISGTGEMTGSPWWAYMNYTTFCVTEVRIAEGVTSISDGAFKNCSLSSVTLPTTLKKIGKDAFNGSKLSDMSYLHIPKSVAEIGEGAFSGVSVKEVVIANEGMTLLSASIFSDCEELTKVTIPNTIEEIGASAFSGDMKLSVMNIPDGVRKVGRYAFENCKKLEITDWPGSLKTIGERAFVSCNNINRITLPDGLTEIGPGAFKDCAALEYVEIPVSVVKMNGTDYGVFQNCPKLLDAGNDSSCNIYFHWTEIPYGAFANCDKLQSIKLPSGVTVNSKAFYNCKALQEVLFSSQEEITLGECIFEACTTLKTIENFPVVRAFPDFLFSGCTSLEKMEIPSSVESIGYGAFYECTGLKKVVIPASVQEVGSGVFEKCSQLRTAGPGSNYNIEYAWTDSIPTEAFQRSRIDTIVFPDTLKELGEGSFQECSMLKSVALPDSLEVIGYKAFSECKVLSHIRLPENLNEIRPYAFEKCPKLKQILFGGDCPLIDSYGNITCEDMFLEDTLTAYYPGDNKTWAKKDDYGKNVKQSYGGEVTWKVYKPSEPVDPTKERSAQINHQGTVSARFYLVDENGMGIPEQPFSYVMHEDGKAYEYTSADIMTDIDGGYVFTTPYYSNTSGKSEKDQCYMEVKWTDGNGKEQTDTFTINVEVTPLAYTESWTIGLGADLSAEGKTEFSFGRENAAQISLKHNKDGTEDLELSLTMDAELAAKLGKKLDIGKGTLANVKITKGKGELKKENVYSTTIYDFNPDNAIHQKELTAYLTLIVFLSSTDVLNLGLAGDAIHKQGYESFEVTEQYIKVGLSAGGSLTLQSEGDSSFDSGLLDIEIAPLKGSTTASVGTSLDEAGKMTYSSGIKSEESFALLSSTLTDIFVGYSGFSIPGLDVCYHKVSDTAVSVDDEGLVSTTVCNYDSGMAEAIGYDEVMSSHSYQAGENFSKELLERYQGLNWLYKGITLPVSMKNFQKIQGDILGSEELVEHTETEKMKNSRGWSPSIKVSDTLSIGLGFDAEHGWSAVTETNTFGGGVTTLRADSSACVDEAKKDKDSDGLGTIFISSLQGLGGMLKDGIKTVGAAFGAAVENGKASIRSGAQQIEKWTVQITGKDTGSTRARSIASMSFEVVTFANEISSETSADAEGVTAPTVGEAYLVKTYNAADSSTEVTNWEGHTLDLELAFTAEDMEAAGGSIADADKLAIYRYDEENGCYIYIGGTVDTKAMTVTAAITQSGEYVLALDGAAPSVTEINVSGMYGEKPQLTAYIYDFSGLKSVQVKLDGEEILSSEEIADYYNARTGKFSYPLQGSLAAGPHTVSFIVTDKKGAQSGEISEEFYVSKAAEFGDIYVQPDAINGMNVQIEASVTTEGEETPNVVAEITGHMKDGTETNFRRALEGNGGKYTGTFKAGSGANYYNVIITARDSYGHDTESEIYRCTMSASGVVDYKIGDTTYKIGLRDGHLYNCETTDTRLEIPKEIYGVTVTSIGQYSCNDIAQLTEVSIPEGVTEIGNGAFSGCSKLSKVTFGKNVEEIGESAFEACVSITEITLPENLKRVDYNAFSCCSKLSKVTFGEKIEEIGSYVFDGCSDSLAIHGYSGSEAERFATREDISFVSIGSTAPNGKCGKDAKWVLENGVLTISGTGSINEMYSWEYPWDEYRDDITAVIIEEGITVIPDGAFDMGYGQSVSFTIPKSVTEIGPDAIYASENDTIIYGYPDTAASAYSQTMGYTFGLLEKATVSFGENDCLTYTVDGDTLTISGAGAIPDYTQFECPWYIFRKQITKIVVEDGVTKIGDYAFYDMDKVTEVSVPESVTEIGQYAIGYNYYNGYKDGIYVDGPEQATGLIVEGSSKAIKDYGTENNIVVIGADEQISLNDCEIIVEDAIYNGSAVIADAQVIYKNLYLKEDRDYTLTCTDNDKVGTAKATLTGIGHFTGTVERTYNIKKYKQELQVWDVDFVKASSIQTGNVDLWHYGDGKLSYQSDTDAVKIDENGKITIAGGYVGIAHIIVTAAETDEYEAATAEFDVEVRPQTPGNLRITNTSQGVSLRWSSVDGVDGYKIYRRRGTAGEGYKQLADINRASVISYTDTSAKTNGERYEYIICAYSITSDITIESYDNEGAICYVSPVGVVSVVNAVKGTTVSWSRNAMASGYKIYRSVNGGSYVLIRTAVGNGVLSYNDTAANANGTRYQYKVSAYKVSEGVTGDSIQSSEKTIYCISRPSLSSAKNSSSKKVKLTWKKNKKANGYEIQYSTSKNFKKAKSVKIKKASLTKKTISKLKKKKTYYIRMRAYKKVSGVTYYSEWSKTKKVKIKK